MLLKAILHSIKDITPDQWRDLDRLLFRADSARVLLPGFVGTAQVAVDGRWFSVDGDDFTRLSSQGVLDVISTLTDTSAWPQDVKDALSAITAEDFIGAMVYDYITSQAKNAQGDLLFLDAEGELTTVDTGAPAGNVDEANVRGEFLGVPIT